MLIPTPKESPERTGERGADPGLWLVAGGSRGDGGAVVWVDGVLVWEYPGGEQHGVESLASICKMWRYAIFVGRK